MTKVADKERATQDRIVKLFQEQLHYNNLGNWEERENNNNIEETGLRKYLHSTGKYSDELIAKAIFSLKKEANINTTDDLYNSNKEVYSMLRYGTSKKVEVIKRPEHVDFIDWKNPL